jgi:hypothetical protein
MPGCAAGRRDVDVDRAVGDALQAFRAVRAKLGADEQLDFDRTVRGLLDIVLEHDQTVIVLVVLVRVGRRAQRDVGRLCRRDHAAGQDRQSQRRRGQCFHCLFQDHCRASR